MFENRETKSRSGFTLVELLVVITIIAMLVGLLTPAVIAARAAARKAQCMNNLKNLGDALIQFDLQKHRFPGYANSMPGGYPDSVSWAVMILPYLQRNDIWDLYRRNTVLGLDEIEIDLFACPSDHEQDNRQLSYVANCGLADNPVGSFAEDLVTYTESPANGVFLYRPTTKGQHVTASRIADGTQHTLLLSENVQAKEWDFVFNTTLNQPLESQVGMIWEVNNNGTLINKGIDDAGDVSYPHARPSSNHSGGVNVVFCDGHCQFLREDIDYDVYGRLMTPDGKNSKPINPSNAGANMSWQSDPLDADDYVD